MKRKIVITRYQEGVATLLYHDSRAVEIFYEDERDASLVGNIYVGKVANVVKNIQAAFIEIENGAPCYYDMEESVQPVYTQKGSSPKLAAGDELVVQVVRDAIKSKAPAVTSRITLSGQLVVLTYGKTQISVSAKLGKEERERLAALMKPYENGQYGWIVRTNAAQAAEEDILAEAEKLVRRYAHIMEIAVHRSGRTCLFRNPPAWLLRLKNMYRGEYDEIVTDDVRLHGEIREYLEELHLPAEMLTLYQDRLLPLDKLYPVEKTFAEARKERVWLNSGAYLVIEPTEALVSIDVNTGKCERGKCAARTFLRINLEAAEEIARQIRLRNLSGIILIDFINMEAEEDKQTLLRHLAEHLKNDRIKTVVVDMTALGLVEVTRKKVYKPLSEQISKKH